VISFSPIPEVLEELRAGRMVVLVDDEARENEGDLVMAAESVTPEAINFMTRWGRGIVCLALAREQCRRLNLPPMVSDNTSRFGTAFTVSIDAAAGVSSGTSAPDRARTILTAVAEGCRPEDLVRPGHVFPIEANDGGVLVRAGHTEGSVDLARLAGFRPAAVLCEVMDQDGQMARLPALAELCAAHRLKLASIADLIAYRRRHERLIQKVQAVWLPTRFGTFRLHLYRSLVDDYLHLALCAGDVGEEFEGKVLVQEDPVMVRVHSECLTGDIFHSRRCDCGEQMEGALRQIQAAGKGVFLYIRQEGRGIGLVNKIKAYALQEQGLDTVEANAQLGLPADLRTYGIGAQILYDLGVRKMRLLTNNPKKVVSLRGFGLELIEQIPSVTVPTPENRDYLRAKRDKLGHQIDGIEGPAE
jgi:3,4-dihydroxy 2-butanone 4-phosphate synthase/GTP cyclohydrolase II